MIRVAYTTPVVKLEKIKIGDEVIDEYQSTGKVVKINKRINNGALEFTFHLDNKQTIYIMSRAV
ncbi:hypothetical protein EZ449_19510 [Pedobacter frigidisoli]|uniref:Uncharacterized protein n=1 Tax=Pedobacter frigidisoli TaxID=2530455 RepID=A0A4R0NMR8_9SPHI|nr:hypothetical protein [Pedobacter frigidisoli]TCD01986.1 hypothetical protein EZ449_19510 [Pedobacter frigidisoli]